MTTCHADLWIEGRAHLRVRPWHITLDGYRVRALPGAVTPVRSWLSHEGWDLFCGEIWERMRREHAA